MKSRMRLAERKGISLPVEMIVIIALAVIVLLAAGAFFAAGTVGGIGQTVDVQAWQRGCGTMKLRGCVLSDFKTNLPKLTVAGYDYNKDGKDDTIFDACKRATGYSTTTDCHKDCCQPGGVASTGRTGGTSGTEARRRRGR